MADHADAADRERRAGLPVAEQVLDHRVELLLRRVPGLEEVVVERRLVDRRDRGVRVGVGGEQHALRVGEDRPGLRQVLRALHPRHALVGDQERDLLAPPAQLVQRLERLRAGRRPHDAVVLAEALAQITGDGGEDRRLVVDGDDGGTAGGGRHARHAIDPVQAVDCAHARPGRHRRRRRHDGHQGARRGARRDGARPGAHGDADGAGRARRRDARRGPPGRRFGRPPRRRTRAVRRDAQPRRARRGRRAGHAAAHLGRRPRRRAGGSSARSRARTSHRDADAPDVAAREARVVARARAGDVRVGALVGAASRSSSCTR